MTTCFKLRIWYNKNPVEQEQKFAFQPLPLQSSGRNDHHAQSFAEGSPKNSELHRKLRIFKQIRWQTMLKNVVQKLKGSRGRRNSLHRPRRHKEATQYCKEWKRISGLRHAASRTVLLVYLLHLLICLLARNGEKNKNPILIFAKILFCIPWYLHASCSQLNHTAYSTQD